MYKFLLAALSLAMFTACSPANSHDSGELYVEVPEVRPKTAAELRAELLDRERDAPEEYVHVQGTHRRNLINQLVLEGEIINSATLARFKDPVLSVTWYSQTDTELETRQYPVYEVLLPQGSTHYKLKTEAPDYVSTVSTSISSATPLN